MERGEDVVELLTVAQCGNKQSSSNSSFTSLSDSELSQVTAMDSVPEEKRLPLIDNATLLVYDLSVRKYTSLTNEGMCVCVCMYMLFVCVCACSVCVCPSTHACIHMYLSHQRRYMYMYMWKSDCLGCAVLLCLVYLFDLACFFLSSLI